MTAGSRLAQVETELAEVTERLRRLEREMEVPLPEPQLPPDWGHAPRQVDREMNIENLAWSKRPEPEVCPPRTAVDFEALFGGRVLAWIGGVAILFAAVLFLGMAISRGWLDEETRTIIAAAISLLALGCGVWLHERRGRTEAAQALVASAIAGLFGSIVVAAQAYSLISPGLGLASAAAVGAVGFAIAVRWRSLLVAAIGSLGALGAFVVSVPQLLVWASVERDDPVLALAVLAGFWTLYMGAAFGYELRRRAEEKLPIASWLLIFAASAAFARTGYWILDDGGHHTAAVVLLFGFAGLQVVLGIAAIRLRLHRELGALLVGLGIALTAIGIGLALHGPALVCGWAAASVVLAALGARLDATPDPALSSAERMLVAAGGFLVLAIGHTLIVEAPPSAIFEGVRSLAEAAVAIAACVAAAFAFARIARRVTPEGSEVAAFVGAAGLVYLGSVLIVDTIGVYGFGETRQSGQAWLSAFWTVTAIGAVIVGLLRRQAAVRLGGLALLAVAIVKVWTYDLAELDELARVLSFVGLGLLLLVGSFAYARIKPEAKDRREESTSSPSSSA
jgi:uncharacterized membrane protein